MILTINLSRSCPPSGHILQPSNTLFSDILPKTPPTTNKRPRKRIHHPNDPGKQCHAQIRCSLAPGYLPASFDEPKSWFQDWLLWAGYYYWCFTYTHVAHRGRWDFGLLYLGVCADKGVSFHQGRSCSLLEFSFRDLVCQSMLVLLQIYIFCIQLCRFKFSIPSLSFLPTSMLSR